MAFQSAILRNRWFAVAIALAFDILIAAIVASVSVNIWFFFLTLGLIWGASILLSVKRSIFAILTYYLFDKKIRVRDVKHSLSANKFPVKDFFFSDPDEYLIHVADDTEAPDSARFHAAVLIGQLNMIRLWGLFVFGLQTNAVLEEAITQYFRENGGNTVDDFANSLDGYDDG